MSDDFADRRKYIRFDLETKVNFKVKKEDNVYSEEASAETRNLSAEGLCFVSDKNVLPGSILKMTITIPSQSQPVHLEGKVMWSEYLKGSEGEELFEIGVKLFTIDKSDEGRFLGYVCYKMVQALNRHMRLR